MQRAAQEGKTSTSKAQGRTRHLAAPAGLLRIALALPLTLVLAVAPLRAADTGGDMQAGTQAAVGSILETRLQEPPPGTTGDPRTYPALQRFYANRDYRPLWVGAGGAAQLGRDLLDILGRASRDGLNPGDYETERIAEGLDETDAEALAEFEIVATRELMRFLSDLRSGRRMPHELDPELFLEPRAFDIAQAMSGLGGPDSLAALIADSTPSNPVYRRLRRALAEYRRIAASGGWPEVPAVRGLQAGATGPAVAALRRRLAASGDLTDPAPPPDPVFDAAMTQAVERFQRRHGLAADGVVGPKTLAALNVPVEERVDQIAVNMERWRWMPDDLGDRYILVNLAGFELDVIDSGSLVLDMRVVVGQPYRRTPVFSDVMTYLEINPFWTVPPRIARRDIVPKATANPGYLAAQNIRVFDGWNADAAEIDPFSIDWSAAAAGNTSFRFRQDPGPANALGRVKFMFPNRFNIYLHDTPARNLFDRSDRAFSSGCIRLERPLELAAYLLADVPGWDRAGIEKAIAEGATRIVRLATPIPVHLTYSTVWIGEGGTVQFRDDVYGRDGLLLKALYGREPRIRQLPQDR